MSESITVDKSSHITAQINAYTTHHSTIYYSITFKINKKIGRLDVDVIKFKEREHIKEMVRILTIHHKDNIIYSLCCDNMRYYPCVGVSVYPRQL